MTLRWTSTGVDEVGIDAGGRCVVAVDPRYYRPAEVESRQGDTTKAREKLGWKPRTTFRQLVAEVVEEDLTAAGCEEVLRPHGRLVSVGSRMEF